MNGTLGSLIVKIALNIFFCSFTDIEPCRKRPETGQCTPIGCFNGTGNCEPKRLTRWFFNPRTSNCENFAYSGCGGTANTFDSAQSCSVACKQRIMRPERESQYPSSSFKKTSAQNISLSDFLFMGPLTLPGISTPYSLTGRF